MAKKVTPSKFARALVAHAKVQTALKDALGEYQDDAGERYSNVFVHISLVHEGHFGHSMGKVFPDKKLPLVQAAKALRESVPFIKLLEAACGMYLKTGEQWHCHIRLDVFVYRHGGAGHSSAKLKLDRI